MRQAGLFRDVRKRPVAIVSVEVVRRLLTFRETFQPPAVDEKQVRPAVVIVVKEGHAAARGLEEIFVGHLAPVDRLVRDPRLARHVGEGDSARELGCGQRKRLEERTARKRAGRLQELTPGPTPAVLCHSLPFGGGSAGLQPSTVPP